MTSNGEFPGLRRRSGLVAAVVAAAMAGLLAPLAAAENGSGAAVEIAVQGNRRIDADTVRAYFYPNAEGRYDDAARDAALRH